LNTNYKYFRSKLPNSVIKRAWIIYYASIERMRKDNWDIIRSALNDTK